MNRKQKNDMQLAMVEAIKHLASKHNTTDAAIWKALADRDPVIVDQFAELVSLGVVALNDARKV